MLSSSRDKAGISQPTRNEPQSPRYYPPPLSSLSKRICHTEIQNLLKDFGIFVDLEALETTVLPQCCLLHPFQNREKCHSHLHSILLASTYKMLQAFINTGLASSQLSSRIFTHRGHALLSECHYFLFCVCSAKNLRLMLSLPKFHEYNLYLLNYQREK